LFQFTVATYFSFITLQQLVQDSSSRELNNK
jgi:hypothetical protein